MEPLYITFKTIYRVLLPLLMLVFFKEGKAQPDIRFNSIINSTTPAGGALSSPIDIVNSGDGSNRLFVVQQGGTIKAYTQSPVSYLGDFLTVSGLSTGVERGLLSMAFHPDYKNNGYLFVYYTNAAGDIELARYHTESLTPNMADATSKKVLLTIPHPLQSNHNGGKLNFGPDGYLYFATGDGGGGGDGLNNAQNGASLLGKMIRIDVNSEVAPFYNIPPDNPFLVPGDNIRDEIWATGLRNPFRWSFDRLTHDMWIADVGQDAWEEVNFNTDGHTRGLNYGWHCMEGTHSYPGTPGCPITGATVTPLLDYPHNVNTGGFAVIGGYVYRGTQSPALTGYYIFADEVSSNVWLLPPNGAAADTIKFRNALVRISAFGEGENGDLFVTTLDGQVHNVLTAAGGALPVTLLDFKGNPKTGYNELNWLTTGEVQLKQFEIEYSANGIYYDQAGVVTAANTGAYHFAHTITAAGKIFYRLKMVDNDGKYNYSKTILVSATGDAVKNFVNPSVVSNGMIAVGLYSAYTSLQIINMDGKTVYSEAISNRTGIINVSIRFVPRGQYLVRLLGNGKQLMQKIIVQ